MDRIGHGQLSREEKGKEQYLRAQRGLKKKPREKKAVPLEEFNRNILK